MISFDMLGMISHWCDIVTLSLKRTVFEIFDLFANSDFETRVRVIQGHGNRRVSIRHLWLPIKVLYIPWAYLVPFPR